MPDLALPPLPPPPAEAMIAALAAELEAADGSLVLHRSLEERTRLSRDFHDYSPVLMPLLAGRIAQLAVSAATVAQVMAVAAACARHGVPLTLRGAGTGNYGQCVPLAGGVVLDLSGLNRVRRIDPSSGVLEAEAGCRLAELDGALAPHGRALRMAPSTWRSATLGGFIAGGSGGIGSVRWGFLRDPGNLLALEVVTVEPQPRLLRLEGRAAQPLNHAYGTNGILTAVTVATAPAVAWQQVVVDFPDWWAALEVARTLPGTAMELDDLTLLEAPLAAGLPWSAGCPPPAAGHHRLLLLVAPDALPLLPAWLAERGGTLRWQQPQGSSRGAPCGSSPGITPPCTGGAATLAGPICSWRCRCPSVPCPRRWPSAGGSGCSGTSKGCARGYGSAVSPAGGAVGQRRGAGRTDRVLPRSRRRRRRSPRAQRGGWRIGAG